MYDYFIDVLSSILYNMSYYTIIRSKPDHLIKTSTKQVSIKVKPNTEIAGKEIYQPRATVAYSESNQVDNQLQKNVQFSNHDEEISHIISPSTRSIKGFKVECINGQIVNKKTSKMPTTPYIRNKDKQKVQLRVVPETHNSFQPVIKQRQSDELMFSLQSFRNTKEPILPEITPNTICLSQNNAIYKKQQKQKTIIESIISREEIIERGEQLQIQKVHEQHIVQKKEKFFVSKQIKCYQIQENHVDHHLNGQSLKSPQKNKQRHPIFVNDNAEFFEESALHPESAHPQVQTFKVEQKYTPIQHIQSPKLHFTPHQPTYYGVDSKYEDESIYLSKQPQL